MEWVLEKPSLLMTSKLPHTKSPSSLIVVNVLCVLRLNNVVDASQAKFPFTECFLKFYGFREWKDFVEWIQIQHKTVP